MKLFVQSGLPSSEGSENVETETLGIVEIPLSKNKTLRDLKIRQHGFSMAEAVALANQMLSGERRRGIIWVEFFVPRLGRFIKKPLVLENCSQEKVFLTEVCINGASGTVFPEGTLVYFKQN